MIGEIGVFEQLPHDAQAKITVVRGDALTYTPDIPVDTLLADIWMPINGDGREDQVRAMRANTGASRVYFWGQEMVIARRALVQGLPLNQETVARIIADLGLPLIGSEWHDYPERVEKAAARWLDKVR